jgi:hypothetical protein
MRVGLITTLNTNLGDDLVREGICSILRETFEGREIEFVSVNKHEPLKVYPGWHPIRLTHSLARSLPRGKTRLPRWAARFFRPFGFSYFDGCDMIVQCGAPVVWPGCSWCEWAEPLWHQVVGRLSRKGVPVLNLGAGSCYPWEKQPRQIDNESDALYLKEILGYCRLTTVRDRLAQLLFESVGQPCPLIPCPALLPGTPLNRSQSNGDLVVINYMEKGGHYDWGQQIDASAWRKTEKTLIERIAKGERVLFLCHDQREYELASALDPAIPRFLPKNTREYLSVLSRAKAALCNRLHAAIALAGMGIPSVAVGTDTRLLMVDAVGLPYLYVKEATLERMEDTLQDLLRRRESERERLLALRERTWREYLEVVGKATRS